MQPRQKQASGGLVLRAVNHGQAPLALTIGMEGDGLLSSMGTTADVTTLSGADLQGDNSPSHVDAIAPKSSTAALADGGKTLSLTLPGFSFTVAVA